MKAQNLKPIACVLAVSIFLAGCNGGHSTAGGSSNSLDAAQAIVNNKDHVAFINMVKSAPKGPVNYEVLNRRFYESREVVLPFNSNAVSSSASNKELAIAALSGATPFIPVVGPFIAFGVKQWGEELIRSFSGTYAADYDPNSFARQFADLQNKVQALEANMEKSHNLIYQALKEQSINSGSSPQHKFIQEMKKLSYSPFNINNSNCMLSSDDYIVKYFGESGLGLNGFGEGCNPPNGGIDYMGFATSNMSVFKSHVSKNSSDIQQVISALVNVTGAKTPAEYAGNFSTVVRASSAKDSALIGVLDGLFTQLVALAPQQGKQAGNYIATIDQYNQTLIFILQSAYNSLQGAYNIENTNNYLNFLNAVAALNGKAKLEQIKGFEGLSSVNFEISTTPVDLKTLEDDYVNKQNNLQMLYAARANIMFNIVMSYIVSDKTFSASLVESVPTSYIVNGKSYSYEVPLNSSARMYPPHFSTIDIPTLPKGNWKESSILYTWNGFGNYYGCGGIVSGAVNEANCAMYPHQESGYYDGDKFSVQIVPPATANLPSNLKHATTISTDWYVASRNMPFRLSDCQMPNSSKIDLNPNNGSLLCDSYKLWDTKNMRNAGAKYLFHDPTRTSRKTSAEKMSQASLGNYDPNLAYGKDLVVLRASPASWYGYAFSNDSFYQDNEDVKFKNNDVGYAIPKDTELPEAYVSLLSRKNIWTDFSVYEGKRIATNYMLNFYVYDTWGGGGEFTFNASCPSDIDDQTDQQRYSNNAVIQPGYISCRTIKSGEDDALYKEFSRQKDLVDMVGYGSTYPLMVEYDGTNSFVLISLYLHHSVSSAYIYDDTIFPTEMEDFGFEYTELTGRRLPCSAYPRFCKAN